MKLNHINLVVSNVAEATLFFETYFDFHCTEIKGDNVVAILSGKDHFSLVLMGNKGADTAYPPAFHFGFLQDEKQKVVQIYEKLEAGSISLGHKPRMIRNSFGSYFNFENIMIEIGCYHAE